MYGAVHAIDISYIYVRYVRHGFRETHQPSTIWLNVARTFETTAWRREWQNERVEEITQHKRTVLNTNAQRDRVRQFFMRQRLFL